MWSTQSYYILAFFCGNKLLNFILLKYIHATMNICDFTAVFTYPLKMQTSYAQSGKIMRKSKHFVSTYEFQQSQHQTSITVRQMRSLIICGKVLEELNFTAPAVEFLRKQAARLDLPISIFYPSNYQNPVVVMTWKGSQPALASIILNSHMDVVPVYDRIQHSKP